MSELLSTLDPRRTAFITLDVQTALVGFYANEDFVSTVTSLLACARNLNATVIHVKVGFRPGFPEVSERNRLFSSLTKDPDYAKMLNTELLNLHPALETEALSVNHYSQTHSHGISMSGCKLLCTAHVCAARSN